MSAISGISSAPSFITSTQRPEPSSSTKPVDPEAGRSNNPPPTGRTGTRLNVTA